MGERRIALWASVVSAALAASAWVGSIAGIEAMREPIPGAGAMRVGTAFVLLAGVGAVGCRARGWPRVAGVLSSVVVLVSAEALVARAVGAPHGLDARLGFAIDDRSTVSTAIATLLSGIALAFSESQARRFVRLSDGCVLVVLLMAMLTLVARAYDLANVGELDVRWAQETAALPAAIALAALGVAILGLHPDRGVAGAMTDRGPAGVLLRHVIPAVLLVPPVLGWFHAWTEAQPGPLRAIGLPGYVLVNVVALAAVGAYAARAVRRLERARAETHRTLVASEDAYRRTFRDVPVGVATFDRSLVVRSANPALSRMLGYEPDELVGGSVADLSSSEIPAVDSETFAKIFAGELDEYGAERRLRTKDGRLVDVAVHGNAVRDEEGRALLIVGVVEDLTERKRVEAARVEREARYRLLAEASPQIVWVAGADGELEYLGAEWSRYAGCTDPGRLDACRRSRIHPEDAERAQATWARAVATGERYELEYRLRRHDGVYHWFLSRAVPVFEDGAIVKWYGADTDIHQLHETREALRISEERFRVALLASPVAVSTQDEHLRYTWAHSAVSGFEPAALLGKTDADLLDRPEDRELVTTLKRRVLETGERVQTSIRLVIAGEPREFDVWIDPLRDARGEIRGIVCSAYEVTERARFEERVRHTEKLESLAALAGGLAHDFNNLLTVVIGNATRVRDALEPHGRAELAPALDEVVMAAETAEALTKQLLAYSGKGRFVVERVDLVEAVDGLARSLGARMPRNIELRVDIRAHDARVEADVAAIEQLVTNLVMNAVEAIGDAPGTISLRVERHDLAPDSTETSSTGLPGGRYCALEVQDDGPGMDAATAQRMFEPFFSTKLFGRGLGLPAAQGIVRAHGGAIYATSVPGRGTHFHVLFPLAELAESVDRPRDERPSGAHRIASRGGCVLFVDDEPPLRRLAESILRDAGYAVLLAEHGEAALELVSEHCGAIDVVVLDMSMPVLGGAETAERLRALCPELPIIASSGYSEAELRATFAATRPEFLRKPYRPSELVAKVGAVLSRRRAEPERQPGEHARSAR